MDTQNGIKSWQWIVTVIVIVLIIIFGVYWFSGQKSEVPAPTNGDNSSIVDNGASINNGIVITDQYPGDIVNVSSVQLVKPGFVVIKKDTAGVPGAVIGSAAFAAGIHPGQVKLTSSMIDGSIYYAALYSDVNGNGKYDIATDITVKDTNGKDIMKPFRASTSVQEVKG